MIIYLTQVAIQPENDFLSGSSCSNGGELDKLLTFRDAPVTDRRKKYRSRKLATATNAPQFLALPRTVQNLRVIPSPVTHQTLARSAASDQRMFSGHIIKSVIMLKISIFAL